MADFYVDSSGFKRYKNSKRLMYNPELFPNHKTKWSREDEIDLVGYRQTMKWEDIALMLGRTPGVCMEKMRAIKRNRKYELYLKKFKEM